eukprot:1160526-Pelagomonas_calceolata.AAC.8
MVACMCSTAQVLVHTHTRARASRPRVIYDAPLHSNHRSRTSRLTWRKTRRLQTAARVPAVASTMAAVGYGPLVVSKPAPWAAPSHPSRSTPSSTTACSPCARWQGAHVWGMHKRCPSGCGKLVDLTACTH